MKLLPIEKAVLTMSLNHMHEHLSDIYEDYKAGEHTEDVERIEDRIHALQTLTIKLLGAWRLPNK